jgi:hypothetical protein
MISLGKILIMPKGNYDANTQYYRLNIVLHNGSAWICKESCKGIEPTESNTQHWMKMFGFKIINRLDYKEEGGVLDARQGTVLKQLIEEKEVYEIITATSGADGKVIIPNKDDYEVYSVMCATPEYTVVGNTHSLYVRSFAVGEVGEIMPNTRCTLAVTYVRK